MPKKLSYVFIAMGCLGVSAAGIAWEVHDHAVHEEQARQAQLEEDRIRIRDERLERSVEEARRVLNELQEPDFWPVDTDLWQVKQITVAQELKRPVDQFRKGLEEDLKEIVALAPQAGKEARMRWLQAADVAYALFKLPEAERYYREALSRANEDRDTAESFRLNERLADVWHSARHFEEERRQREYIATMRANSGQPGDAPLEAKARLAICLHDLGKAQEGLDILNKAFDADRWELDKDHPDILFAATIRSFLLHEMQRYTESEMASRRVLSECERVYGADDLHTAIALGRLVACDSTGQNFSDGARLAPRAVELCGKFYGKEHPMMGMFLRFAASACAHVGDYATAEKLAQRSLEIHEAIFPADHIEVGHDLGLLGYIAEKTNRLADSERYFRGALDIYRKNVGPDSHFTLSVQSHLNTLQWELNEKAPADSGSAAVGATLPSPTAPEYSRVLYMQGQSAAQSGHYREAADLVRRAIAADEKREPEGVNLAQDYISLAQVLNAMKQNIEAEAYFKRGLAIMEKKYGPNHPEIILVLNRLAGLYVTTGRPTEGEQLLKRVIDLGIANDLTKNLEYARAMNTLAYVLQTTKRFDEALPLQRKILTNVELTLGKDNETYGGYLHSLGQTLLLLKREDEGRHAVEQAVAIGEKLPTGCRLLPVWLTTLAAIQNHSRETPQADATFRRALSLLYQAEKAAGQPPPPLQNTAGAYTVFLKEHGLTHAEIDDRLAQLRKGEDVPALPAGQ
ncbi:tetratricopeptide repeat protein [Chthoniobacter flavus]|nr:tetratricopeptide repeat protein [Chthoniobacter flavus]